MSDLLERIEGAEKGSVLLSCDLALALGEWTPPTGAVRDKNKPEVWRRNGINFYHRHCGVTTSLDAALALAERLWPNVMWRVGHDPDDGSFKAELATAQKPGDPPAVQANGFTPALALCAAVIRARGEPKTGEGHCSSGGGA